MEVSVHSDPFQTEPRRLSQFIRQSEADIVAAWECAVRELPDAANLERPALIDHIPDLLEEIAYIADQLVAGGLPQLPREVADKHALQRLEDGFDLEQVGHELAALRDCTVRLWSAQAYGAKPDWTGVRALNQALDKTVAACIQRYVVARDRTIAALDRISLAALETRSLDEFLDRLLHVLVETTPAVDTATILLRDGDQLRVHASVGLGDEVAAGFTMPIGEGFAGTIAKTRRPHFVCDAVNDPSVVSPFIREHGVRALYGVPLVHGDDLIGVAHMGSTTAPEFSASDRQLLGAMTTRAILGMVQHLLVTEHKRMENDLRAREIDNARLLEQAQHETHLREEILAVVSHDLKNPLGAVHLAVQMLHDTAEPQTRKYVDMIHRAATRMDHLIGDLLDMASVQAGRLAIERTPEDADALVREAIELHQAIAVDKGIHLTGTSTIGRDKVSCDRNRVLQVLCNLAGNAMKFCRPGDSVTIQCRREGAHALFTVADTGPGIPDSELPHIFEPYWSAARHVRKGTGLGLYISRGIVEAHGERIWVESTTQGRSGTSFYFTLPLAKNRTH